MAWYNYNCQKITKTKHSTATAKLLAKLTKAANRPHKLTLIQFYQREYYTDRLAVHFDARWAAVYSAYEQRKAAALQTGQEIQEAKPYEVSVRTAVAKERWEMESDGFKEQVTKDWEEDWDDQITEYKLLSECPKTPEEFDRCVTYSFDLR